MAASTANAEAVDSRALLLAWLRAPGAPADAEQYVSLNSRILDHLHSSHWPEEISPAWQERILRSRRASAFLNQRLAKEYGWTEWFPSACDSRLLEIASLSPLQITRLRLAAGACLAGPLIRKTVRGEQIRELKNVLGEPLLHFVRLQAPYLKLPIAKDDLVEAWTSPLAAQLESAGLRMLYLAFSTAPAALARRIQAKTPKSSQPAKPSKDAAAAERALQLLTVLRREERFLS